MKCKRRAQFALHDLRVRPSLLCFPSNVGSQVNGLSVSVMGPTKRLTGILTDTEAAVSAGFASKFVSKFEAHQLKSQDIVNVTRYQPTMVDGVPKIMVLEMEVIGEYSGRNLPDSVRGLGQTAQRTPAPIATSGTLGPPISPSECDLCVDKSVYNCNVHHSR
jgi:hypothetical protein